jgi:outer membrane protein assembly factor BamD
MVCNHCFFGAKQLSLQPNFAIMKKGFYTLLLGLLLLTSCSKYNNLLSTSDVECKYEAAKAYFISREYGKAAPLLEDIVSMLKGNRNAEESLYMLAMCYYESGDYETASQYFKTYYTSYQRGMYNELARFYCGKSLYKNIPVPELDQSSTHAAIQELQLFLEYYPATQYRADVHEMLFAMYDILVEKDYLSAKLYYDLGSFDLMRNNYQACIVTAQNALKEYPYTKLREELSILILRAKYKMATKSVEEKKVDRFRDAVDEYYAFKNEFPESKYLDEAEKYFREAQKELNE